MKTFLLIMCLLITTKAYPSDTAIKTIAYEASGETYEGQVLVASVIKQRMLERNQTAEQVVLAKSQFSCWKDGKPTQKRTLSSKALDTAKKAWEEAKALGWNHYCRYDVSPSWIKAAKVSKRVGNHIFYKL
jgi:spore germination cell wall hydrolase CwlJ-like protein